MSADYKEWFYNSKEFQAFFRHSPRSSLIKANPPYYTIAAVSESYLQVIHRKREELLGSNFFEIFPGNALIGAQKDSLLQSFESVIKNKAIDVLTVHDYRFLLPGSDEYITQQWSNSNEPLFDDEGNVNYIICTITNITDKLLSEQALEEAGGLKASLQNEQTLNEQHASATEELRAVNEELHHTQLRLSELNNELAERVSTGAKQLEESELRLRSIFEQAPLALCILDGPDLVIKFANDHILNLWKESPDVIGKSYYEVRQAPESAKFLKILSSVYATGIAYGDKEVRGFTAKGNEKKWGYFTFTYQPIKDGNGNTTGVLVVIDDVTEVVEARTENERMDRQLNLAVNAAGLGYWYIHPQTKTLDYNRELARIFGYEGKERMTYDEAIGQVTEEYRAKILEEIETAIANGGDYKFTYSQRRFNDDKIIWLRSLGKISQDEEGNHSIFAGVVMDITEQVMASQAIQNLNEELASTNEEMAATNEELTAANEEYTVINEELSLAQREAESERQRLFQFIMEAPAGIAFFSGPDLIYEFANPAYQALVSGYDILHKPLLTVFPEAKGSLIEKGVSNTYRTGRPFEINEYLLSIKDETGQPKDRYFNFRYIPRRDNGGDVNGIFLFTFDVTDTVNSRKQLEQAYEEMNLQKQAAQLGTFDVDLKNNLMAWDDRCRELFGISHNNPVAYASDFTDGLHPEDKERVLTLINNLYTDLSLNGNYDVEYRTVGVEDNRIRWVRAKGKVYFDDNDKPERFAGMVLDITEQKKDEQRKNDFIGMVSHEMKTPLTSLSGYLQLLRDDVNTENVFTVNMLDKANQQINRITSLINGFLNVSRLESGKIQIDKKRFDMAQLIKEAEDEAAFTINSHRVIFSPVENVFVDADRDKIAQVITNLISNATKYSPPNTVITIACIKKESNAVVSVKDEGIGIKEEDCPKIFDRYYRVNENNTTASGFGIGLYLCAEIIQRHNGKIWVESEVGKGSTFAFSLPVVT